MATAEETYGCAVAIATAYTRGTGDTLAEAADALIRAGGMTFDVDTGPSSWVRVSGFIPSPQRLTAALRLAARMV